MAKAFRLHDYQSEIVARLHEAWKSHRAVMVQMPTGTGKTHVLASLVNEELRMKNEEREGNEERRMKNIVNEELRMKNEEREGNEERRMKNIVNEELRMKNVFGLLRIAVNWWHR